jgi:uncharacterized protein DUF3179
MIRSLKYAFAPLILFLGFIFLAAGYISSSATPALWRIEGWTKTDFNKTSVDFSEILSGGPPKDGIPSIDNPKFVPVSDVSGLTDTEPVISLEINGDARAYPFQILMWHEIVNDVIAGTPIVVTYCPLCNSAVVFDRRFDGKVLEFGTTGKLRKSNLIMYDRQTETWWQQFVGAGIVGKYMGKKLKTYPARIEAFGKFKTRHAKGKVLVPNDDSMRMYGRNPYTGYDSASTPFLYRGDMPKGINPMARVIAFKVDGKPQAVSMELLRKKSKMEFGDVVISWQKGQNSALDTSEIAKGRDVGNVVVQRKSASGAEDILYDVTFAFVFYAFHPERPIINS